MATNIHYAYLAPEGFQSQLAKELKGIQSQHGRLIVTDRPPEQSPFWVQNCWRNPIVIPIDSISDAVQHLKSLQRNWSLYSFHLHRRGQLIQEQLPYVSAKPRQFPMRLPQSPLGSWTLLDRETLLAASDCSSPFPNGAIQFVEDKTNPPNRAYLKLWEALTMVQHYPTSGQFCIDVGASPGGWTWVLATLGAEVLSIDRSSLDRRISTMPGVSFQKDNAFSLSPKTFTGSRDHIDWLFSDLVCYPEKLFDWVMMWVESGICDNFICTLKFQGDSDYQIAKQFAAIPHSQVLHLLHNKHELTWIKLKTWETISE
ncbi:MAG: SAM-dependent methyltransferase [Nitrospirales bacterium]